jgi:hypothetical protein
MNRKLPRLPDLVATHVVGDRRVAMKKADFLARVSRIANEKGERASLDKLAPKVRIAQNSSASD